MKKRPDYNRGSAMNQLCHSIGQLHRYANISDGMQMNYHTREFVTYLNMTRSTLDHINKQLKLIEEQEKYDDET